MTEDNKEIKYAICAEDNVGYRIYSQDLYLMLGAAIRYSLSRQTYMSGECAEWCEKYASALNRDQRASIIKDIQREIDKTSSIDRPYWEAALKSLDCSNVD